MPDEKIEKTNDEWRSLLPSDVYAVCREKGTEPAFTGAYHDCKDEGIYQCACCATPLFSSENKFDSGTGWPSFWTAIAPENVATEKDNTLFMRRTEVLCNRCNAHLGHVFDDGPQPTGLRYCMNSLALTLVRSDEQVD